MMGLGPYIGREYAHDLVYDICREALKQTTGRCSTCWPSTPRSTSTSTEPRSTRLCDPANYLGQSGRDGRSRARHAALSPSRSRFDTNRRRPVRISCASHQETTS